MLKGDRRRFEIGDRVRTRVQLYKTEPGTEGEVFNVIYGNGRGACCLSVVGCNEDHLKFVGVLFDDGRRVGVKFNWLLNELELVRTRRTIET